MVAVIALTGCAATVTASIAAFSPSDAKVTAPVT
jgi:hypothetical protein